MKPKAIAFDIIETVFPLQPLKGALGLLGLPASSLDAWFASGLRDAFALSATGGFAPFTDVLRGSLDQLLGKHGLYAEPQDKDAVFAAMKRLPAAKDAAQAFSLLREADIPIIALSNGARASTRELLEKAGFIEHVAHILSVEDVKVFKPHREVYLNAVTTAGVQPEEMMLIATHAWDVHGAKAAGLQTGFVSRGQAFPKVMMKPDLAGEELVDVVQQVVQRGK